MEFVLRELVMVNPHRAIGIVLILIGLAILAYLFFALWVSLSARAVFELVQPQASLWEWALPMFGWLVAAAVPIAVGIIVVRATRS